MEQLAKLWNVKHESYNSQTNFWHVNGSNFAQLDMLGCCRLDGDSPWHVNKTGMWRDYDRGRVQVRLETLVFMVTGVNSPIMARSSAERDSAPHSGNLSRGVVDTCNRRSYLPWGVEARYLIFHNLSFKYKTLKQITEYRGVHKIIG